MPLKNTDNKEGKASEAELMKLSSLPLLCRIAQKLHTASKEPGFPLVKLQNFHFSSHIAEAGNHHLLNLNLTHFLPPVE